MSLHRTEHDRGVPAGKTGTQHNMLCSGFAPTGTQHNMLCSVCPPGVTQHNMLCSGLLLCTLLHVLVDTQTGTHHIMLCSARGANRTHHIMLCSGRGATRTQYIMLCSGLPGSRAFQSGALRSQGIVPRACHITIMFRLGLALV